MAFPAEHDLRDERRALLATVESLSDEEFESAPTLCTDWAPRDIVAHLMGVDTHLLEYVKATGQIAKANAAIVARARPMSRERLMNRARHWADKPAPLARVTAIFF